MRVLQLIDSLEAGGAERIAVSCANMLSAITKSYLCSTRAEGALLKTVDKKVSYLFLNKKTTIDIFAIWKLKKFIKNNKISIIHAHSSSYFLAVCVKLIHPKLKIIWHNHYGNSEQLSFFQLAILKLASYFFSVNIAVNDNLKKWAIKNLHCKKVYYVPNFVDFSSKNIEKTTHLKGIEGKKIVCLANFRPAKDHFNLIKAFAEVQKKHPEWTLHLVGKIFEDTYSKTLFKTIKKLKLENNTFSYGSCDDVDYILQQAEIGLLSSKIEGLPVSLLEYGKNQLAVIVTNVGDCATVVTHEKNGLVVSKKNSEELEKAIIFYIENPSKLKKDAIAFKNQVKKNHSLDVIIPKLLSYYENC